MNRARKSDLSTQRRRARACVIGFAFLALASCDPAEKSVAISPQQLATLVESLHSVDRPSQVEPILAEAQRAPRSDPDWPTLTYLVGEVYRKGGQVELARDTFRNLVAWAVSQQSPAEYPQAWGGSALAGVALWRWLQILNAHGGAAEEIQQALESAAVLRRSRLFAGLVGSGLLPALPLLEEDVARLLAHIAWKAKRTEAMALYLDFVNIDSTGEIDVTDELIRKKMISDGLATPERLDLFRFRRQLDLVKTEARKERAAARLKHLWLNKKVAAAVRAEAGYEWSNFRRQSRGRKQEIVAALTSVIDLAGGTGPVTEKALYLRAMVQNSVNPKRPEAFFSDMSRLLEQFPDGRLADDALFQLASEHLFGAAPDVERALFYFERLRAFEGSSDWLDSAYLVPALGLVDRGAAADLQAADMLLAKYLEQYPEGPFRMRALFWRGRIAERGDGAEAARRFFRKVVEEAPFDYYGLRARMHLESGPDATVAALPRPGSRTWSDLREAYRGRAPDIGLVGTTPYHGRVRSAERNGLYARSLAAVNGVGRRFHGRLDSVPLQQLDEHNLIPTVALHLSLRQDALVARDSSLTADNQLRLAGFIGRQLRDWPVAMAMLTIRGDRFHPRVAELHNDPRFLATAYPGVDVLDALKEPFTREAWVIEDSATLSASVMYAVARRESGYFPGAISEVGALGLFQIMPLTFAGRSDCWRAREDGRKPTAASYLFDAARNTQFWSCWVRKEFPLRSRDEMVPMLVKHHAGVGHFIEWHKGWTGRPIERDLELQIDTFRFRATQLFVRQVLSDVAIVEASGLFEQRGREGGKP